MLRRAYMQGMKDLVSLLAPKPAPLGAPPTYAPLFQARAFQL